MIAIGSDHGGFLLKQEIKAYLEKKTDSLQRLRLL